MHNWIRCKIAVGVGFASLWGAVDVHAATLQSELARQTQAFLTGARSAGGVLQPAEGDLKGLVLPLSFVDSAAYWSEYVCRPPASCAVQDVYRSDDYTLMPTPGNAADLQIERVVTHAGTNIYDAATWQIAVMLGAGDSHRYARVVGVSRAVSMRRAPTQGAQFVYQGERMEAFRAYAFRAISGAWLTQDPLSDTALITASGLPANDLQYRRGAITWPDWKPITGENAWAFLIGPLQAAYLHYIRWGGGRYVPFDDAALQNALDVLPAFAALQSPIGAVYYAPAGTATTRGEGTIDPNDVSVENNLSLYAGLTLLAATLQNTRRYGPHLGAAAARDIDAALRTIHVMVHGGDLGRRQTAGLLSFFKEFAWREGEFVQGGLVDAISGTWRPHLAAKAVDVQTWGIAALGARQIESWFGFGSAFELWQRTKRWGGYGVGSTLWGVGYSDRDGNGHDAAGNFRQGNLSAEWTAGAINMVRHLIRHYEAAAQNPAQHSDAQRYVRSLRADEAAMLKGVEILRVDRYAASDLPGKPPAYAELLQLKEQPAARGAYVYASRRYAIPFGWYANPLPSTCASAWMLMLAHDFDPFAYGGGQALASNEATPL